MTTQTDEELVDGWIIKCKCLCPEELTINDLRELVALARQEAFERGKTAGREEALKDCQDSHNDMLQAKDDRIKELEKQVAELKKKGDSK